MLTGAKIGKVPGGTLGMEEIDPLSEPNGCEKHSTQLKSECPKQVNPLFGNLSHEQWIKLNLRHAELHLSFQIPQIN